MEASKTIIKGAIDGMTENQYLLGEKYFYGSGETRNVALAESWYKEAAKQRLWKLLPKKAVTFPRRICSDIYFSREPREKPI